MTQPSYAGRIAWAATTSALAVCLVSSLAGCGADANSGAAGNPSSPEEFKARIVYVESRPDSYTENGHWTGLSADAVHAVLKKMGAEVESESASDIAGVIPGLAAGRYNLVGSSFFMTPERCKQVAFSDPLLLIKEAMAYGPNVTAEISNIDSLIKNPELRLGLVQGSAEVRFVTAAGIPDSRITKYPDVVSTIEALKGGRVDVVMVDNITLTYILKTTAGVEDIKMSESFIPVVDGKPANVENALMFPKGQDEVVEAFNTALVDLRNSGELASILEPYGVTEQDLAEAGQKTAKEVCAGT